MTIDKQLKLRQRALEWWKSLSQLDAIDLAKEYKPHWNIILVNNSTNTIVEIYKKAGGDQV